MVSESSQVQRSSRFKIIFKPDISKIMRKTDMCAPREKKPSRIGRSGRGGTFRGRFRVSLFCRSLPNSAIGIAIFERRKIDPFFHFPKFNPKTVLGLLPNFRIKSSQIGCDNGRFRNRRDPRSLRPTRGSRLGAEDRSPRALRRALEPPRSPCRSREIACRVRSDSRSRAITRSARRATSPCALGSLGSRAIFAPA